MNRKPRLILCGLPRRKIHMIDSITKKASAKPTSGETTIGITTLSTIVLQCTAGRGRERGADQTTDQRVRGRRRQAEVPGDEVPGDRADEPGHHDHQAVDGPRAARWSSLTVCATCWPSSAPTKFITAATTSAMRGRQGTRRDRGRDRVGGVVEPVGVVEREGDDDDRDDDREVHAQDSLTAICSTMLATDSNASMASSRESTMSLSLSTSRASYFPLNSLARIRR